MKQHCRLFFTALLLCFCAVPPGTAANAPKAITHGPGNDTEAAWSPDGRRLVFQTDRAGDLDLYLLDLKSGKTTPLVTGPGHACFPAWSPDGRWIAYSFAHFTRTAVAGQTDGYNLFVIPATGGKPRRLTHGLVRDYTPTFSRDGQFLYFSSTRGAKLNSVGLYRVPLAGGEPERLLHRDAADAALLEPDFSADGKLIACSALSGFRDNWSLRLLRTAKPQEEYPLTEPDAPFYAPAWDPRGERLACAGYRPGDPGWGIYLIHARAAACVRLETGPGNSRSPVWSPDGRQLVFENNRTGAYKLYRLTLPPVTFPPTPSADNANGAPVLQFSFPQPVGETVADASGHGNQARVTGALPWAEGGIHLNGGFLSVPEAKGCDFGQGAFSVRAVVQVEKHTNALRMIAVGEYPGNRLGWQLYLDEQNLVRFNSRDAALQYVGAVSDAPLPLGRKVTLIGMRRPGGRVELIVNGRRQAQSGTGALVSYPRPVQIRIGTQWEGHMPFNGWLYELTISPRALSRAETLGESLEEFLRR